MNRETIGAFHKFAILLLAGLTWSGVAGAQEWVTLPERPAGLRGHLGVPLLLTDGTILVQQQKTGNWWILTPDNRGHYNTGTWSTNPVSIPFQYAPQDFASAVLPDGRLIVEGGEYDFGSVKAIGLVIKDTNQGAIYNPVKKTWATVLPPIWPATGQFWNQIGDAPSVVAPEGFLLGSIQQRAAALLDPVSLTWTVLNFSGKADCNSEEGWTLLPDGNVLTIDTYCGAIGTKHPNGTNSEIYTALLNNWTTAGGTKSKLWSDPKLCGPVGPSTKNTVSSEIGPAVLRPNGTVFATGANLCRGPGNTAIYDTVGKYWIAGPPIPPGITGTPNNASDTAASILPDGNVLVDTNPSYGKGPNTFWEFGLDDTWISIPQPALSSTAGTQGGRMVVTGEGSVMVVQEGTDNVYIYTKHWKYPDSYRPTICAGCAPSVVHRGQTYIVTGTQFNGLSQGAAYGDDAQSATNFPLVQITNPNGNKSYARTHDFSNEGLAPGIFGGTKFDVPPNIDLGKSTLVVIANGIPSQPVDITVEQ